MELSGVRIVIERADLTKLEVDAVVNAANSTLVMGAGVAGALLRAGGSAVQREALAQGPIESGQAVLTTAGALPARHVIHAATMGPDLVTSSGLVHKATASALALASERGLLSIAFPALGTGVGGLGWEPCAQAMLSAVREAAAAGTSLQVIHFALFEEPAVAVFKRALTGSESRG
jgi:O-acetyl-ADP-ribose deacetylase (regulator of RNase III)